MALRKQPLVHIFPGEEAPRKPGAPPNRIIRDAPPLALLFVVGAAWAALVSMVAALIEIFALR